MTCINLNRTNLIRMRTNRSNASTNIAATRDSVAWGKKLKEVVNTNLGTIHALVFSAVLIACSLTLGCSSDQPKPVSANNQIPGTPAQSPVASMPVPVMQADAKPSPKKVARKKPATVNYTDKTYGVTFEYPRRYAIETGDAAAELLRSNPVPMNFVEPGGVALAAVELPETGFADTDFSSAFFNVSVHKTLTADQCNEFAVPQPKNAALSSEKTPEKTGETVAAQSAVQPAAPATTNVTETKPAPATSPESSETQTAQAAPVSVDNAKRAPSGESAAPAQTPASQPVTASSEQTGSAQPSSEQAKSELSKSEQPNIAKVTNESTPSAVPAPEPQASKLLLSDLMLKDMELYGTEAVSGEGTRQSDSKYFHIFQNGTCYEFALNVTTVASEDHMTKHVDRDKVFSKLEKIMATVKIDTMNPAPVPPEVTAEKPVTAAPTPAQ